MRSEANGDCFQNKNDWKKDWVDFQHRSGGSILCQENRRRGSWLLRELAPRLNSQLHVNEEGPGAKWAGMDGGGGRWLCSDTDTAAVRRLRQPKTTVSTQTLISSEKKREQFEMTWKRYVKDILSNIYFFYDYDEWCDNSAQDLVKGIKVYHKKVKPESKKKKKKKRITPKFDL